MALLVRPVTYAVRSFCSASTHPKRCLIKPGKIEFRSDAERFYTDKKFKLGMPSQELIELLKKTDIKKPEVPFVRDPNFVDY